MKRLAALAGIVLFTVALCIYAAGTPVQRSHYPAPARAVFSGTLSFFLQFRAKADAAGENVQRSGLLSWLTGGDKQAEGSIRAIRKNIPGEVYEKRMMQNSTFAGSRLDGSVFLRSTLESSTFDGASMRLVQFTDTSLISATGLGANFSGSSFLNSDLSRSVMESAIFDEVLFRSSQLAAGRFTGASFEKSHIIDSLAVSSSFEKAAFDGAVIRASNFRYADLTGTDMTGALVHDTDLEGADLSGANLSDADFSQTRGLTQEQLGNACGNEWTRLPSGLRIQPCPE